MLRRRLAIGLVLAPALLAAQGAEPPGDRLDDTARGANRGSLVVYTLDPRGVQPLNLEADDFDNAPASSRGSPRGWRSAR